MKKIGIFCVGTGGHVLPAKNLITQLNDEGIDLDKFIIITDERGSQYLKNLDIKFAWIVNSEDGLDEISPYAKTKVIQLKDDKISEILIDPNNLEINADNFNSLLGDDAKFNANKMIDIFKGEDNDFSKAVCLNAAAGLVVAEKFVDFKDAYNNTREYILSGESFKH